MIRNKPFSLLIKPASADCNLDCTYCFYLEKGLLYSGEKLHRMTDMVLERLIGSYMQTEQPVYSFGWQGGEPTLMGLPFYQKVVSLQQRLGRPGASVANGLQTNATLIDRPFADHLAKFQFLVGCSLDGPADLHNQYRLRRSGHPTHDDVIKGVNCLKNAGVSTNILVLVSRANVDHASEIYKYLLKEGHFYHQYIPCVEFDENGEPLPFSITGAEWGRFLSELFEAWYQDDVHRVSIRHVDSILSKLVDGTNTVCTLSDNCCQYFVVEHNGDVYPCDFFVEEKLKLGNIMTASWDELLSNPRYLEFGDLKNQWNPRCATCDFLDLCNGDCLKHRLHSGNDSKHISYLCDGWKTFWGSTKERFGNLAELVIRERRSSDSSGQQNSDFAKMKKRVGRNEPCPCGSGRKFKKCCGSSD